MHAAAAAARTSCTSLQQQQLLLSLGRISLRASSERTHAVHWLRFLTQRAVNSLNDTDRDRDRDGSPKLLFGRVAVGTIAERIAILKCVFNTWDLWGSERLERSAEVE